MTRRPIVAIDGPSGSGKSTVGKRVARALGFLYVDTGALFRAVALRLLAEADPEAALGRAGELARRARIEVGWEPETARFSIRLDGRDVSEQVRSADAARWASRVAAVAEVREVVLGLERALGAAGGVVMEGRDIGTVVFPDAEHKFFLDADPDERSRRRGAEEGRPAAAVGAEMRARDRADSTRAVAPLDRAPGAVVLDTTRLGIEQVVAAILAEVGRHRAGATSD